MFLTKIRLVRIGIFFAVILSLFIILPKNARAADNIGEGYGWGRTKNTVGTSNTVIYKVFDSVTGAALSADSLSITIPEAFSATPWPTLTYTCSSACPTSQTFSNMSNNHADGQWVVYSNVCKAGYHCSINPAYFYAHIYSGTTVWTYNIYLNPDTDAYRMKVTTPTPGSWLNYDPPYPISLNASYTVSGSNTGGSKVEAHLYAWTSALVNTPGTVTAPAQGFTDGYHNISGLMEDNSAKANGFGNALSGQTVGGDKYGIDTIAPTSTCSVNTGSPITLGSAVSISLSSTDSSTDAAIQANVFSGEIQSSPDGVSGWANIGTVTQVQYTYSGATNQTATYNFSTTPAAAGNYYYRYRARDAVFDSSGNQTQWGAYATCTGSITVVTKPDLTNVNTSDTTNPVITVTGATLSGNTVNAIAGTPVTFSFRSRNIGTGPTINNSCTVVEAFGSTLVGPSTTCQGNTTAGKQFFPVGNLAANTSATPDNVMTTSWTATGSYAMLFRVDAFGNVSESDETNNDVHLTVVVTGNFTIGVLPASTTVEQGSGADYVVTLNSVSGFSGNVTLSAAVSNDPGNTITNSFTGGNVVSLTSGGTATVTLHAQTSLPPTGTPATPPNYLITVNGVSGALSNSAPAVTLMVTRVLPKPWLKTTKGDVGSYNKNIAMGTPAGGKLYSVINVVVTDHGSGYSTAPTVTIAAPTGTVAGCTPATALATASIYNNQLDHINVTNVGNCYTSAPAVTVNSGNGKAVALISSNADYLTIVGSAATISTFTSAKSWLVTSTGPTVDPEMNVNGSADYYNYLWTKIGSAKAQTWNPTCNADTTVVGGLPASSCVLLNTTNTVGANSDYGGVMADNGVFKYTDPGGKPDLLYNMQAAPDGTHLAYDTSNWNGDYAGKDLPISGNPTVIFVPSPGKLQINRPILTTGNKKLIFVVQGDVEINPTVKEIDANIITNGTFKDSVWLNQNNQKRYTDLVAIEGQLKKFYSYVGYYPYHAQTDTSEGCSTSAPYSPSDFGWWWQTWLKNGTTPKGNAAGDGNWDGQKSGVNNFQYDPCPATPVLDGVSKSGLRWYLSVRSDLPAAYYSSPFELNNYLDPINGKNCGSAPYTNCGGKNIATSKAYAYRYLSWWPGDVYCFDSAEPTYNTQYGFFQTCATAYNLSFNVEDDGYLDRYSQIEGTLYTLCGGDYNRRLANSSWLESNTGGYSCSYWPLKVNGSVIAQQGGFSLQRDVRDDNNSTYFPNHPPIPAETFNYDPSILYYFAKASAGQLPFFAEQKPIIKEVRP